MSAVLWPTIPQQTPRHQPGPKAAVQCRATTGVMSLGRSLGAGQESQRQCGARWSTWWCWASLAGWDGSAPGAYREHGGAGHPSVGGMVVPWVPRMPSLTHRQKIQDAFRSAKCPKSLHCLDKMILRGQRNSAAAIYTPQYVRSPLAKTILYIALLRQEGSIKPCSDVYCSVNFFFAFSMSISP